MASSTILTNSDKDRDRDANHTDTTSDSVMVKNAQCPESDEQTHIDTTSDRESVAENIDPPKSNIMSESKEPPRRKQAKKYDENNSMTAKHSQISSNMDCRSTHLSTDANLDTTKLAWSANEFKNAGNKLCCLHRYEEAILYYNKAITRDPEVASYYSNRALCHLKLQQWSSTIQDCRRAIELDPNILKGHFFLGQGLAETGNFDESLKHLYKANELAKANKLNFGDDITYQIRLIKRRRWSKLEHDGEDLEDRLHSYLKELIRKDKESKLKEVKLRLDCIRNVDTIEQRVEIEPTASTSKQTMEINPMNEQCQPNEQILDYDDRVDLKDKKTSKEFSTTCAAGASQEEPMLEMKLAHSQSECDTYLDRLDSIFQNLRMQRKNRDVPDYLCGKISFELMRDPVITPSGITYDRRDIEEHLKRVGHFDPITRQPLKSSQLISNLAMKDVVDAYIKDNEWALYC